MWALELKNSKLDQIIELYKEIGALPDYSNSVFNKKIEKNVKNVKKNIEQPLVSQTLEGLREDLINFEGCDLKHIAINLVFSDGNPDSDLMLIGEAPGEEEDKQGKPFVGRSGQLLDKMLASIGIDRTNCYIANIVPWRPPGNRVPTTAETSACLPFIKRHIQLIKPKVMVCLGATATKALLSKQNISLSSIRGKPIKYEDDGFECTCIATFHPAYLLRSPSHKAEAFQDLKLIRSLL